MKGFCAFMVLGLSAIAIAEQQSIAIPVGERVYVDTGNLWEPLQILPRSSGVQGVLDPNFSQVEPAHLLKRPRQVAAPKKVKDPSSLVFEKVTINGRLGQPRVQFGRTRMDIGRVEERTNTSHFNRIFEVRPGDL